MKTYIMQEHWFYLNKLFANVWYFQQRHRSTWSLCSGVGDPWQKPWQNYDLGSGWNMILGH